MWFDYFGRSPGAKLQIILVSLDAWTKHSAQYCARPKQGELEPKEFE